MLFLTREVVAQRLLEIPALIDAYSNHHGDLTSQAIGWFTATEQALARLRHPAVSFVAVQRGRILAAEDGLRDEQVGAARVTRHKAQRAAVVAALGYTEESLQRIVTGLDARLGDLRDRMAQLVTVASLADLIAPRGATPRDAWIREVWASLATSAEGRPVHAYLSAVAAPSDLLVVLGDILDNLANEAGPPGSARVG